MVLVGFSEASTVSMEVVGSKYTQYVDNISIYRLGFNKWYIAVVVGFYMLPPLPRSPEPQFHMNIALSETGGSKYLLGTSSLYVFLHKLLYS